MGKHKIYMVHHLFKTNIPIKTTTNMLFWTLVLSMFIRNNLAINIILEILSEKMEPERIIRENVKTTLTYKPQNPEW